MKHQSKFSSGEEEQHRVESQSSQTAREFSSVEEMLRHDSQHVMVPPVIAERLAESIKNLPPPKKTWRDWLGL
jgi:hypothetical protein